MWNMKMVKTHKYPLLFRAYSDGFSSFNIEKKEQLTEKNKFAKLKTLLDEQSIWSLER